MNKNIELKDKKIKTKQIDTLLVGMGNDLLAFFKILEDKAEKKLKQAIKEGWTPEQLISAMDNIFEEKI